MRLKLATAADTDALGKRLAVTRPQPAVVALSGQLGAGKSSLARAMLRAPGVVGSVRSPTYTLHERTQSQAVRRCTWLCIGFARSAGWRLWALVTPEMVCSVGFPGCQE